eukprot:94748-Chlamydomonas_euryale.AAC.1
MAPPPRRARHRRRRRHRAPPTQGAQAWRGGTSAARCPCSELGAHRRTALPPPQPWPPPRRHARRRRCQRRPTTEHPRAEAGPASLRGTGRWNRSGGSGPIPAE